MFLVHIFTFVRHQFPGLEVHLGTAGHSDLVDVVANLVAAVLSAAEAQTLVESLFGVAAVCHTLLLDVQQRVDEQVDGALVGTFDELVHICSTAQSTEVVKKKKMMSHQENFFHVCSVYDSWHVSVEEMSTHIAFLISKTSSKAFICTQNRTWLWLCYDWRQTYSNCSSERFL